MLAGDIWSVEDGIRGVNLSEMDCASGWTSCESPNGLEASYWRAERVAKCHLPLHAVWLLMLMPVNMLIMA